MTYTIRFYLNAHGNENTFVTCKHTVLLSINITFVIIIFIIFTTFLRGVQNRTAWRNLTGVLFVNNISQ